MTILLVDAGNSRLKWSELSVTGVLSTQYAQAYADRPALAAFIDLLESYPNVTHITLVHVLTHLLNAVLPCSWFVRKPKATVFSQAIENLHG